MSNDIVVIGNKFIAYSYVYITYNTIHLYIPEIKEMKIIISNKVSINDYIKNIEIL